MQLLCDADGVIIFLYLCFLSCICFFVLGYQDPSTSSLQNDFKSDEENSTLLTAKDGTKWK